MINHGDKDWSPVEIEDCEGERRSASGKALLVVFHGFEKGRLWGFRREHGGHVDHSPVARGGEEAGMSEDEARSMNRNDQQDKATR